MGLRSRLLSLSILAALPTGLLVLDRPARAENGCPSGYEPWKIPPTSTSDCMAIPDYGQGEPAETPTAPEPVWADRWGAIAIGSTESGGGVGVSVDAKSQRAAERAAIDECVTSGGGATCKSEYFSYNNQCAVIAWGNGSYVVQSADTIDLAASIGLARCNQRTSDCRIFYSGCSLPARIG